MSIRISIQQTMCLVVLVMLVLLLTVCGGESTPTASRQKSTQIPITEQEPTQIPITKQESQELLREWGLRVAANFGGSVGVSAGGRIEVGGDMSIHFLMDNPPTMTFVDEDGEKLFTFEESIPLGDSEVVVILTTSEFEYAQAMIPRFTPIPIDSGDSTLSYMVAERFADYDGDYQFRFGFTLQSNLTMPEFDINIFYEGSQHHIYGEIELFGVRFKNDSREPLVFEINSGKYVYIEGIGTATTRDGSVIHFGE